MRPTLPVLLVLNCIALGAPAIAQELSLPAAGTTFVYDSATRRGTRGTEGEATKAELLIQVLRIEGDVVSVVSVSGRVAMPLRLFRGLFTYEFIFDDVTFLNEIDFAKAREFWPLEVGRTLTLTGLRKNKRGQEELRSSGATFTLRLAILRQETVETPVGRFEAAVIERTLERFDAEGKLQDRDKATTWYVPKLGWYVRHDSAVEFYRPDGQRSSTRASSLILKEIRAPR